MKIRVGMLVIVKFKNGIGPSKIHYCIAIIEEEFLHEIPLVKGKAWRIRLDDSIYPGISGIPACVGASSIIPLLLLPKKDRCLAPCAAFQKLLPRVVPKLADIELTS